jgi:hypothetical protein
MIPDNSLYVLRSSLISLRFFLSGLSGSHVPGSLFPFLLPDGKRQSHFRGTFLANLFSCPLIRNKWGGRFLFHKPTIKKSQIRRIKKRKTPISQINPK